MRVAARLRGTLPSEVVLKALWKGQQKSWRVPLNAPASAPYTTGIIAASWARARLAVLESQTDSIAMSEDQRRNAAVELSKHYGVLSKETTFIAIEHRSLEERTRGTPELRRVPVMLAQGWGQDELLGEVAGGATIARCAPAGAARRDVVSLADSMSAPAPACPAPPVTQDYRRQRSADAPSAAKRRLFGGPMNKAAEIQAAPREPASDPLQQILMLQSAAGFFTWNDLLLTTPLNGKPWQPEAERTAIQALLTTSPKELHEKLLATALALHALQTCFADQEDLWRLAAEKAKRWLKKNAPDVAAKLQPATA